MVKELSVFVDTSGVPTVGEYATVAAVLVPTEKIEPFGCYMRATREKLNYEYPLHFADMRGKADSRPHQIAKQILECFTAQTPLSITGKVLVLNPKHFFPHTTIYGSTNCNDTALNRTVLTAIMGVIGYACGTSTRIDLDVYVDGVPAVDVPERAFPRYCSKELTKKAASRGRHIRVRHVQSVPKLIKMDSSIQLGLCDMCGCADVLAGATRRGFVGTMGQSGAKDLLARYLDQHVKRAEGRPYAMPNLRIDEYRPSEKSKFLPVTELPACRVAA